MKKNNFWEVIAGKKNSATKKPLSLVFSAILGSKGKIQANPVFLGKSYMILHPICCHPFLE